VSRGVSASTQPGRSTRPLVGQEELTLSVVMKANPHLLRQAFLAARIGLSTLPHRFKGAVVVVAGVGVLAFVLLSILSVAEGLQRGILNSGDPSRVIIHDADSFEAGWITGKVLPANAVTIAAAAPGVARAKNGAPLVDGELYYHSVSMVKRNNGEKGGTLLMGAGVHWRQMTPSFRLLSGRLPRMGTRELMVGTLAARKFSTLDAGFVDYQGLRSPVVGSFRAGTWWDGYLVADAAVLKATTRSNADKLVRVRLASASAFGTFHQYVAAHMPANVIVEPEPDYYGHFWDRIPKVMVYTAYLLGALVGAGVPRRYDADDAGRGGGTSARNRCVARAGL
jgi:putative ABC transport system permease protein